MKDGFEKILIELFCILGPLGNLIPIMPSIASFRFYYLILFIGVLYFLCKHRFQLEFMRTIINFFPLILLMFISSSIVYIVFDNNEAAAENPMIRFGLLLFLFIFTIQSGYIVRRFTYVEKIKCIFLYLSGYYLSMVFGYIFFIGFYAGVLSIDFISQFEVLTQMGYGILRFSPGSYPNEYGIVSSYVLSLITLLIYEKPKMKIKTIYYNNIFLFIMYLLTIVALFLATTRAAYISYFITLLYLLSGRNSFIGNIKRGCVFAIVLSTLFLVVQNYVYDIFSIIEVGYNSIDNKDSSFYQRVIAWENWYKEFSHYWIFGVGFGRASDIHNTYLQLFFELGIVGALIVGTYSVVGVFSLMNKFKKNEDIFLKKICVIGLMHVLWFAMSNHNINHHLTWFVIFTLYMIPEKGIKNNIEHTE